MLPIFPFEVEIYEREGIPVEFVGHPLVDLIDVTDAARRVPAGRASIPAAPTVALLPGSRPNELRALLPVLAAAMTAHRAGRAGRAVRGGTRAPPAGCAARPAPAAGAGGVAIVEGRTDDVLHASATVITASGTATVQTALHEKPMVIVYRLSPLTYRLGRPFVRSTRSAWRT